MTVLDFWEGSSAVCYIFKFSPLYYLAGVPCAFLPRISYFCSNFHLNLWTFYYNLARQNVVKLVWPLFLCRKHSVCSASVDIYSTMIPIEPPCAVVGTGRLIYYEKRWISMLEKANKSCYFPGLSIVGKPLLSSRSSVSQMSIPRWMAAVDMPKFMLRTSLDVMRAW